MSLNAGSDGMSDELKELIDRFRDCQMSEAELETQIISFGYGNAHYENSRVTRAGVARHSSLFRQGEDPKPIAGMEGLR